MDGQHAFERSYSPSALLHCSSAASEFSLIASVKDGTIDSRAPSWCTHGMREQLGSADWPTAIFRGRTRSSPHEWAS